MATKGPKGTAFRWQRPSVVLARLACTPTRHKTADSAQRIAPVSEPDRTKKIFFTDINVARALHPHQSLPDPSSPPLLSLTPNPSPYQPFRGGVLGKDASDITFLTCSPTPTLTG
eukprot:scaffold3603_cov136-Isochrysis_galbana.AAC.5